MAVDAKSILWKAIDCLDESCVKVLHIFDNHLLASFWQVFASGNLMSLEYFFWENKIVGGFQFRVKTPTLNV